MATHNRQRAVAAVLVLGGLGAGCSARAPAPGSTLEIHPREGLVVGHLDAARAVGPSDGAPRPQRLRQLVRGEDGRRRALVFVRPGLAEDFRVVLPAGRYELVDGLATNGHPDGATRRADWWATGVQFEVLPGQVTCVGRISVVRQRSLAEIFLPRGGGAYNWSVDDTCAAIGERLAQDHPGLKVPEVRLATGAPAGGDPSVH